MDSENDSSNTDDDSSSSSSSDSSNEPAHLPASGVSPSKPQPQLSPEEIILRIEELVEELVLDMDDDILPVLRTFQQQRHDDSSAASDENDAGDGPTTTKPTVTRRLDSLSECRSYTSLLLVLSFVHALLLANKTATTREAYYHFITHFRSQRECDATIRDVGILLQVPRHDLGLRASPRGWFCGNIQLVHKVTSITVDGRLGCIISSDWLDAERPFHIVTKAAFILVIEKEGVYRRLVEDGFFDRYNCILVTGKGYPDLATRALVYVLHTTLGLPVYGLADCDPHGISVLHTFVYSDRPGLEGGDRYSVYVEWLGLRISQVEHLKATTDLPAVVFQKLTEGDQKRIQTFCQEGHRWVGSSDRRLQEVEGLDELGYKVELEALNWLGMEYLSEWVGSIIAFKMSKQKSTRDTEWMDII